MRVLVLGASGMTGRAIVQALGHEHTVLGTYFKQRSGFEGRENGFFLDAGEPDTLRPHLAQFEPDVIISSMRGGFEDQIRLHRVAAEHLQHQIGGRFIFLSTANVFDNATEAPHVESDAPDAQSDYGRFKITCECMLTDMLGERAAIIRVPFIWSKTAPRFLKIRQAITDGKPVMCHRNLWINHTTDEQIALGISRIIRKDLKGIFHIGSSDVSEYSDFLARLLDRLGCGGHPIELELEPDQPYCMAMISERTDLGADFKMSSDDVIDVLVRGDACS